MCDVTLSISSREGVEIDFCPQCRGVWLDRGELDKVIERAGAVLAAARRAPAEPPPPQPIPDDRGRYGRDRYEQDRYERDRYERDRYDDRYRGRRKKKKGFDFLEDLFEF